MATVRGRGRGVGGGGAPRGGAEGGPARRGSWQRGPPASGGTFSNGRGGSPVGNNPATSPRVSINDHMNVTGGKVQEDKGRTSKGFQTDTDISASTTTAPRELKPWVSDGPAAANGMANGNGGGRDSETFGGATANIPWDQFETNERLFGTKTSYQEEIYTTKLNRTGADFKKREKEADKLASEIIGQSANNSHLAEERNQLPDGGSKDEEERYSGVTRNPNAYVPPGARRPAGTAPIPPRATPPSTTPKTEVDLDTPATFVATIAEPPAPTAVSEVPHLIESSQGATASADESQVEVRLVSSPQLQPTPASSAMAAAVSADGKDGQLGTVVDQFRHFVGTEREKVQAKKQSMAKSEREKMVADLKKFQTSFKVPLPMPKDMLPILAKSEEKQKAIEQKAADALEIAKKMPKSPVPATPNADTAKSKAGNKMFMKIPEIPPFDPTKRKAPVLPVPETASQNIPLTAVSPSPSAASQASASGAQSGTKLNPTASTFVFKPNPTATAFKPGQSSTSPAAKPADVSPAARPAVTAVAGPSVSPKNPFFRDQLPQRIKEINPRDDFDPWKHGQVPSASSISPQWPYTGRKYHSAFAGPPMQVMSMGGGFEEDPSSPHSGPPNMMQAMPPNFSPYGYRFAQPGMPPPQMPGQMQPSPMFSPGPSFAQSPGQTMQQQSQHMPGGPQQPNGMPMYFQNGMPPNAHFIPPQHMQFNPNSPQRPGPGPGMYYSHQIQTPQHTPQMHQNTLQSSAQPHFQQPPSGGFDGPPH